MLNVVPALAVIALIGATLHRLMPKLNIDSARRECGILVLNVMLPALNIEVLSRASLGGRLWQIPLSMAAGIAIGLLAAIVVIGRFAHEDRLRNSLILACVFGNVTYLGLPMLRGLFPANLVDATGIAILCEITVTSLDLVAGTVLAAASQQRGHHVSVRAVATQLLKFPLLWSLAVALLIRLLDIPLPPFLMTALHLLGQSASGLMLLVLGMALKPEAFAGAFRRFGAWWPLIFIKLALLPLVVGFIGARTGLSGMHLQATTLEAAMPPQLFIFVVADRFGFDTDTLAVAIACLTVISFFTVPLIFYMTG